MKYFILISLLAFIMNLSCNRSAYAEVKIINVSPIDTPYMISLSGVNRIELKKFFKDTMVFLKLVGIKDRPNTVRFDVTG
jgi:hypothetical protein